MFNMANLLLTSGKSSGKDMSSQLNEASKPISDLIKSFAGPVIGIVAALGIIYCILLGVKYAKAEEPQDREKAKGALKNAIIGFILIFVLIVALTQFVPILANWMGENSNISNVKTGF